MSFLLRSKPCFLWLGIYFTFINAQPYGVSYNTQGELVHGAGTSVYLKAGKFEEGATLKYPYTAPMTPFFPTETILLSYYNQDTKTAQLTTATINENNEVDIVPSMNFIVDAQIRGLTTLTSSLAIATLYIPSFPSVGKFMPITINNDQSLQLHLEKAAIPSGGSVTYPIGRLSDREFIAAYYDSYTVSPQMQHIVIGTVHDDTSITLSNPLQFGNASHYHDEDDTVFCLPLGVVVDNTPAFIVPWYSVGDQEEEEDVTVNLCIVVGRAMNGEPTILYETCNTKYRPAYRADNTASITNTSFALAFYDKNSHYGVTILIGEVTSEAVLFGESVVVPGTSNGPFDFGAGYAWSPSPMLTVLSETKLAVAFHHSGENGRPSTAIFSISASNQLHLISPVVPYTLTFAGFNTTVAGEAYATVLAIQAFNKDRYFASFLGPKGTTIQTQASVVTHQNPTIGLMADTLVLTGISHAFSRLIPGFTYYVTGTGAIRGTDPVEHQIGSNAILLEDIIASADAKLGIAIDEMTLEIQPAGASHS